MRELEVRVCSEIQSFAFLDVELEKHERFSQVGEYGELAIKKFE